MEKDSFFESREDFAKQKSVSTNQKISKEISEHRHGVSTIFIKNKLYLSNPSFYK